MHEYGIVRGLLSLVDENVRAHAGRRAVRVVLGLGGATAAEEHALRDAFEAFKAGTTASDAELVLEHAPLNVYCLDCTAMAFLPGGHGRRCPQCGSGAALPVDRQDIYLKSVEIEVSP